MWLDGDIAVTSCRVTQMEVNCIYKICLLHYLLFLVLFTQFIFHTFKNLNTLVKTLKLITVGLCFLCMENVNFFQPCILCLKQKLTLDHILLYKVSQKHLMVFEMK